MIWVFLQELINIRSKSKTKTALAGLANPSNPHTASCTWTLTVKVTTKTRHRALQGVLCTKKGTRWECLSSANAIKSSMIVHSLTCRAIQAFNPWSNPLYLKGIMYQEPAVELYCFYYLFYSSLGVRRIWRFV